jgi:hypothetical protein
VYLGILICTCDSSRLPGGDSQVGRVFRSRIIDYITRIVWDFLKKKKLCATGKSDDVLLVSINHMSWRQPSSIFLFIYFSFPARTSFFYSFRICKFRFLVGTGEGRTTVESIYWYIDSMISTLSD